MNIKEGAVFCPHCMNFVDSRIEQKTENYTVKGREVQVCADVRVCAECGTTLFDRELDQESLVKAYAVYRKEMGLLSPEDIKRIRQKYRLSQTAFAKVLGLGEKTIARYESGSIQDEAQNNLIQLMEDSRNFEMLLSRNGYRLTLNERVSAMATCTDIQMDIRSFETTVLGGVAQNGWSYDYNALALCANV